MASEEKSNLYLLSIVGIVAVVGIVVLVLNSSGGLSVSNDLTGQALTDATKPSLKASFSIWNLKDIKEVTDIVYKFDDETLGLGAIYPATTSEGKKLLSITTAISVKDKKNTLSVIKDEATGNLIGTINKQGEVNDFFDDIDFVGITQLETFTTGGFGYYWINDEYIVKFGNVVDMQGTIEEMFELASSSWFGHDCETYCFDHGTYIVCYTYCT